MTTTWTDKRGLTHAMYAGSSLDAKGKPFGDIHFTPYCDFHLISPDKVSREGFVTCLECVMKTQLGLTSTD